MIRHLFISPDHNYFGRHGESAGENPSIEVEEIECVADRGIRGDRFLDHKPDYKGQITFFMWENLVRLWDELHVPQGNRDPSATRRNVITEDLDLPSIIGKEFELQGVRFQGTEECRPCYWMNGAIHPGAEAWMGGRGGLRARIMSNGVLKKERVNPCRKLVGALFAGGKSSRMGRDKACIEIAGVPLWKRQIDLLKSACETVVISAPVPPAWLPDGVPFVQDSPAAQGPLAGLLAILERAASREASHVLALAVDLPRMTHAVLHQLIDECRKGTGSVRAGVRGFEPLCAVYPVEALPVLQRLSVVRSCKMQEAVKDLLAGSLLVEQPQSPGDAAAFFNLNSPEELAALSSP